MTPLDLATGSSPTRPAKARPARGVLVLALARGGWGETTLGLRIAAALREAGRPVHFLVHPALAGLFAGAPGEVEVLGAERDDALDHRLEAAVRRVRPGAILLADLLMALTDLRRRHAGPAVLSRFDLPILALDPWSLPETGGVLDLAPGAPVSVAPAAVHHPLRLVPVPFARPGVPGAIDLRPPVGRASDTARRRTREELGLDARARLVFLATAGWQHQDYPDAKVRRVAAAVPALLGALLAGLGPELRVLHVGPAPLPWAGWLGDRYAHRGRMSPDAFHAALGASDLLLSLNAPATTSTAAVALGVPVLTVFNSFVGEGLDALWSWLGERPAPEVVAWARHHLPLYRFLMWPMSAWGMVGAALRDNPYDALLHRVELLDARRFRETFLTLLSGDPALEERRLAYNRAVAALPGPAEQVARYLEG